MIEISDIIKSYETALQLKQKVALATVVKVEGSSYRQPGARMLVTEEGQLIGAISGGCLEGDALKKALLAIHQNQNKLVTYDTSNEDDVEFGVQLGCNGIVHILFEPINEKDLKNPIQILKYLYDRREDAAIVTLFSENKAQKQIGTVLFYSRSKHISVSTEISDLLIDEAILVLSNRVSSAKAFIFTDEKIQALIEFIPPSISLIIAGAGNDVKPLVDIASVLGWQITVFDGRSTHATAKRFPNAQNVFVAKPAEIFDLINVDQQTFFVLMTHNYKYDLALLKLLLDSETNYIGILGPKTKLNRMFDDLENEGVSISEKDKLRIYGPVGMDIGAETSEEIAISIVAEIKAIISNKKGTSLKYKSEKIHAEAN